jgi:hypothetical protein
MCGAPNEDDALFCGNCGAVMDPENAPEEMAETASAVAETASATEDAEVAEAIEGEIVEEEVPEILLDDELDLPMAPPPPPPPPPRAAPAFAKQTSGLAIASLVSGIVGWTIVPFLGSILAIILGYMARNEIRQRPGELEGEGFATAGLVLGWLAVGLTVIGVCLFGLGMCFFFGMIGAEGGGYY